VKYSIVMPCFNQLEYTIRAVNAVRRNTKSYELIIVDNGSSDGTFEWLKAQAKSDPRIRIIRNDENKGFVVAVNQGMAAARATDWIVLLNNDTIVGPKWVRWMETDAKFLSRVLGRPVGLVGPSSNFVAGSQFVPGLTYDLNKFDDFAVRYHKSQQAPAMEIGFVSGFCMMVNRKLYEAIGGMDERFSPGGFDDNDYSLRSNEAGFANCWARDVFVHHFGQKTIGMYPDLRGGTANWKVFYSKYRDNRPKRLLAAYRVKNAAAFLKKSLDRTAEFVDGIVVLVNKSEDNTLEIAKSHPKVIRVEEWKCGFNERDERNRALEMAAEEGAEWIISVDADEIFEDKMTYEYAQRLIHPPNPEVKLYTFTWYTIFINDQDGSKWWRSDGIFGRMAGPRLFKVEKGRKILLGDEKGLHCGNVPVYPREYTRVTSVRVKHLGYDSQDLRERKYSFYSKLDEHPDPRLVGGESYRHLVDTSIRVNKWDENSNISLCMVVKNEGKELPRLLDELYYFVDEVVLVDTGSTDDTKEIADYYPNVKIYDFKWNDSFSDVRNFAKDHCSSKWILHMDADEHFDTEKLVTLRRMMDEDADGWMFFVKNIQKIGAFTLSEAVRLFRNIPEFYYTGRVHENFDECLRRFRNRLKIKKAPFMIEHRGYLKKDEDLDRKLELYERLNIQQMKDDPMDSRPYFNLALHRINEGAYDEAEELLYEALKRNPNHYQAKKELASISLLRALVLMRSVTRQLPADHPFKQYAEELVQAIQPFTPETPIRVGSIRHQKVSAKGLLPFEEVDDAG